MICPHDHHPCTGTSDAVCRQMCERLVVTTDHATPEIPPHPGFPIPRPAGPIDRAGYLLALIERLTEGDPCPQNVDGLDPCRYCAGTTSHADDCPWVEARKVLGK